MSANVIKVGVDSRHEVVIVNANDRDWTKHRYVLGFGAYSCTRLMVWANSLDDALDECIDWIVDHAPGLLADDEVAEEFARLVAEGATEDDAHEQSLVDVTTGGNCGNTIHSHEWCILAEDPPRAAVLAMLGVL